MHENQRIDDDQRIHDEKPDPVGARLPGCQPGRLAFDAFDTSTLPGDEGHAVWRESLHPLFNARAAVDTSGGFAARIESYDLQQVLLARSDFPASIYERGRHHAPDEGADPFLVQLYLSGGYRGHNGHRDVIVQPGDISLLDMGEGLTSHAKPSRAVSLVVPRALASEGGQQLAGGAVLRAGSPLAAILGNHMLTVWQQLDRVGPEALAPINETLVATMASAFRGARQDTAQGLASLPEQARLEAVCAYIVGNLGRDDMTPSHLCQRFGFSRARLYRLFAPLGGVAGYIREARLRRCYDELAQPDVRGRPRRVIDVAMRWGFGSQSHFSRLFRQTFGVSPGDVLADSNVRALPAEHRRDTDASSRPALRAWLDRLRQQTNVF
ncbi:MAG: helix-turn-helix domain-containing protein [Alcanivorax sp.]|nr:helix-turn-helix domain-containing protein [Alcanivorax sp.]